MTDQFYTSVIQWGNRILYRGYKDGRRVHEKVEYSPTLFVSSKTKTDYKTLYGEYVSPMSFGSINDAKDFNKRYEDVDGFNVFGMTQYAYQFISDQFPGEIHFDPNQLLISSIDIEVASENGFPDPVQAQEEVLLISIHDKVSGRNIVFGSRSYDKLPDDKFDYRLFKNEKTLLSEFLVYWQQNTPDVFTGWNIEGFDIPYLINRIVRILGEDQIKKLSPWGMVTSREMNSKFNNEKVVVWDIMGVLILDYLDLYKKFTYSSQESYALGNIASIELGDTKLEMEGSFKDAYTNDWNNFVRYNAKDSELVARIEDKLKFIELVFSIAFLAKCNIKDVFGPVKTWDIFIYNYLKAKNIVIPQQSHKHGGEFEGAWVKEPIPGMYGWTLSFDFEALYPKIIIQWNMSPETIVGLMPGVNVDKFLEGGGDVSYTYAYENEYSIAANGAMFEKTKRGIIPEVVDVVLSGRKIAKKEMLALEQTYNTDKVKNKHLEGQIASLNGKQMAFKILANSLYGALSNAGFRYFDLRIAEAITLSGQASDRHIERTLNSYMNSILKTEQVDYVIAGDTDSVYLNVDPLVKRFFDHDTPKENIIEFLSKIGDTKLQEQLYQSIAKIYAIGNCYTKVMNMKREAIASRAIWTAKKRYAMMVHNSEGVDYHPYKMKIMGMDLIKSSTPLAIRKKLKEALTVIFEHDEPALHSFVSKFHREFEKMSVEEIAFPRGINDMHKWEDKTTLYKSKTPIHVRGAILYNDFNKNSKDVVKITVGDKIKFVYLRVPNPLREDVVSFPSYHKLPESMGLHKYIDREKQWDKVFISPLKGITTAIGWQPEKTASLADFFI